MGNEKTGEPRHNGFWEQLSINGKPIEGSSFNMPVVAGQTQHTSSRKYYSGHKGAKPPKQAGMWVLLETKQESDKPHIAVMASHNKSGAADKKEGPIKLAQAAFVANELARIKDVYGDIPMIYGCDFNTDYWEKENDHEYQVYIEFENTINKHGVQMEPAYKDVYGEVLPMTCPKWRPGGDQKEKLGVTATAIDFVLHTPHFTCAAVQEFPATSEIEPSYFPGYKYPSDHPAMVAVLVLDNMDGKKVPSEGTEMRRTAQFVKDYNNVFFHNQKSFDDDVVSEVEKARKEGKPTRQEKCVEDLWNFKEQAFEHDRVCKTFAILTKFIGYHRNITDADENGDEWKNTPISPSEWNSLVAKRTFPTAEQLNQFARNHIICTFDPYVLNNKKGRVFEAFLDKMDIACTQCKTSFPKDHKKAISCHKCDFKTE